MARARGSRRTCGSSARRARPRSRRHGATRRSCSPARRTWAPRASCWSSRWRSAGCAPGARCSSPSRPSASTPATGASRQEDVPRVVGGPPRSARAPPRRSSAESPRGVHVVSSPGGGRDDEALREHLPRREHRVRERDGRRQPQLRARPDRGHTGCGDQAVRVHAVLPGPRRRRALHPLRSRTTCSRACASAAATRRSPSVR